MYTCARVALASVGADGFWVMFWGQAGREGCEAGWVERGRDGLEVAADLGEELRGAGEALLVAQAGGEGDLDGAAVEAVAEVLVQGVDLEHERGGGVVDEGGVSAEADRCGPGAGGGVVGEAEGAGVDARAGEQGGGGVDVGGAHAELAAAAGAAHDDALDAVPAAEHGRGALDGAGRDGEADLRAAELCGGVGGVPGDRYRRHHLEGDVGGAQQLGQLAHAALPAGAEAKVRADHDGRGAQPVDQQPVDEALGAGVGERAVEGQEHEGLEAERGADAGALSG